MGYILRRWVPDGPVLLCGDDTVDGHRGKMVYGKACHRDAVRSTHSFTAYRWGHKWVVLAVLVKFPFAQVVDPRPNVIVVDDAPATIGGVPGVNLVSTSPEVWPSATVAPDERHCNGLVDTPDSREKPRS